MWREDLRAPAPGMSRRAFVGRAAGMGASALLFGGLTGKARAALLATPSALAPAQLPSGRELARDVRAMVALGARYPGTPAHRKYVDWLEHGFASAGLSVSRDRFRFTQWLAQRYGLTLLEGRKSQRVPVSSYFTFSGPTTAAGVEGQLVYVGAIPFPSVSGSPLDLVSSQAAIKRSAAEAAASMSAAIAGVPGGVKGRIALVDAPIAPLQVGDLDPLLTYRQSSQIEDAADYKRAWTTLLTLLEATEPFRQAGAAGVVFALDASAANAAGQFTPFINSPTPIPALIVDRDTGAQLRRRAAALPRARLTLTARVTPSTPTDSLVAILPGATDEVMIVNTHTDGMNAFEENAGIAQVALARYFAAKPRAARRRTLVFSAVTGHFGPGLPQTAGFVANHPDLIKRAAASLTIEHFGSNEWLDDLAHGYHPSGRVELGAIFHSQTPIAAPAIQSLQATALDRTELLRPAGDTFFGVGASLHAAGVPSVAYIAGPNYLLAEGHNGHLDKLNPDRFAREVAWSADLIQRLDAIDATVLGAGDTTLLGGRA